MEKRRQKLVLVGWDSADWKIIHPLLDSGPRSRDRPRHGRKRPLNLCRSACDDRAAPSACHARGLIDRPLIADSQAGPGTARCSGPVSFMGKSRGKRVPAPDHGFDSGLTGETVRENSGGVARAILTALMRARPSEASALRGAGRRWSPSHRDARVGFLRVADSSRNIPIRPTDVRNVKRLGADSSRNIPIRHSAGRGG